ncbi:MAG: DNA ligase D [Clostridia bacterium]|nr:DNA ligase D [Clostridia bacterium]
MTPNLEQYRQKRDLARSGEPAGDIAASTADLCFVVQRHASRREHYDFRLEWQGVLLSWAVPKGPSYDTRVKRLAVQVEDHPLAYRNFEGVIPAGEYGGGTVMLWDEGYWQPRGDVAAGLRDGALKFILQGSRLKGGWALVRLKAKEGGTQNNWLLLKEKDRYAGIADSGDFAVSITSGRTMAEIAAGAPAKMAANPFQAASVQLAKLAVAPPQNGDWLYELKYDGYRILAFIEGNHARLMTRNNNDYSGRFPAVAAALSDWAKGRAMVLDGELAVTDAAGKTDFQALQNYLRGPRGQNLVYIVFDLLALDGADWRARPLSERKARLEELLAGAPDNLLYSRHISGQAEACFAAACAARLEGIVGKRADSLYSGTRNGDWIKLKCVKRKEFVIGGYTLSEKKESGVSSLLLGVYEGGDLIYAGRAGSGFGAAVSRELATAFAMIKCAVCPFHVLPPPRPGEMITWLRPELAAEIRFAGWTKDRLIRQASFKGLRMDKNPCDINREKADDMQQESGAKGEKVMAADSNTLIIAGIKITHPDKVVFDEPRITKADVVRYYQQIAPLMLPYISQRILSIVRCPKGIAESCFYKKHPGPVRPGVVAMPVTNSDGIAEDYFYIDAPSGLIAEAQMGTLEFHAWCSRVDTLDKPDMMVFDLDPDEGMGLDLVRRGVLDLKNILSELQLISYLKTSGGKGYHVVVPFQPAASWDMFYAFARRIAEVMEQKWPERYTANMRKTKRINKIFIDWLRNGRGATSIAPYSLRARKGATVSMPIAWHELETIAPGGVDMAAALLRVQGNDPWQGFFQTRQTLK